MHKLLYNTSYSFLEYMVESVRRSPESIKNKNIRSFEITDNEIIDLGEITDYKWKIYEPLLNALRTTREQTESGEIQITPLAYETVKRFFPKNADEKSMLYTVFQELNKALAPNSWSVIREGEETKKPIDAPWFLRGPDDNGIQSKGQPKPKQKNTYDRNVAEEKKRAALRQFEPLAFGTSLLHQCLSNLTNPDARAVFTKDPAQAMLSLLPRDLKPQDVIGDKTPLEFLQDRINDAINSINGKSYEVLSVKQQAIIQLWQELEKQSGQPPNEVIFQHFGIQPNSNNSS